MTAEPTQPPAALPSTIDFVAEHAARHPDRMALLVNGSAIDYRTFYRDIANVTEAFRKLDLQPGQTVGIEHPHIYVHWLASLGLEALGVVSFSYGANDIGILINELRDADLLLCTRNGLPDGVPNYLIMDQGWIDGVRRGTPKLPLKPEPILPDTPLRITRSSGTTGTLKHMHHTGRIREFWLQNYIARSKIDAESRYLISVGFTIEAMLYYATACLRLGGTCLYEGRTDLATVLSAQEVSHVALPAYALKQLLDGLPENYEKPKNLTIYVISAAVPQELRERIHRHLSDTILESYGTSECGGICEMDGDGVGRVRAQVTVEVVDDSDTPLQDEPGRIRVRSPGVISGYIGDPEATAHMFRNGWFYPGDLGIMRADGTLELIGRADDMLNIGGTKFLPGPVEERLREGVAVEDLCLVALPVENAPDKLCIVVVPLADTDPETLRNRLSPLLPADLEPIDLVFADHIPRTEMGKARRAELVQALQQRDRPEP